ncbi:hypothetical protein EPH_0018860 [Eimeria praecox]|uniref:Transmembrane protein n=1 Tax=Eimeria praecox TaxID=51316 RepID=U6H409_9EIME|nr:hypothetical protein EPH_0018860 [Eimeria praecox]
MYRCLPTLFAFLVSMASAASTQQEKDEFLAPPDDTAVRELMAPPTWSYTTDGQKRIVSQVALAGGTSLILILALTWAMLYRRPHPKQSDQPSGAEDEDEMEDAISVSVSAGQAHATAFNRREAPQRPPIQEFPR